MQLTRAASFALLFFLAVDASARNRRVDGRQSPSPPAEPTRPRVQPELPPTTLDFPANPPLLDGVGIPSAIRGAPFFGDPSHPLNSPDATVDQLAEYVRSKNFTTPEEFVCSLSPEARGLVDRSNRVLAAPGSVAAQSGAPASSRMIIPIGRLVNAAGEPRPPEWVVTINGGTHGVHRPNSAELAKFDRNGTIQYFDLDCSQKPCRLIGPNPQTEKANCMACHERPSVNGVARVRPLIERIPWVSFLNPTLEDRLCSEAETAAYRAMRGEAETSARSNPRFECLSPAGFTPSQEVGSAIRGGRLRARRAEAEERAAKEEGRAPVEVVPPVINSDPVRAFDRSMDAVQSIHVAQLLRATPDYERYKYLFVGLELCKIETFAKFREWVPPRALATMSNESAVNGLGAGSGTPLERFRRRVAEMKRADERSDRELAEYARDPRRKAFPGFSENFTRCMQAARMERAEKTIEAAQRANPVYGAYVADSFAQTVRDSPDSTQPLLRFAIEGRGISMSEWGIDPTPGRYTRPLQGYSTLLAEAERDGGALRELLRRPLRRALTEEEQRAENEKAQREGRTPSTTRLDGFEVGIPDDNDALCAALQKRSIEALAAPAATGGGEPVRSGSTGR